MQTKDITNSYLSSINPMDLDILDIYKMLGGDVTTNTKGDVLDQLDTMDMMQTALENNLHIVLNRLFEKHSAQNLP